MRMQVKFKLLITLGGLVFGVGVPLLHAETLFLDAERAVQLALENNYQLKNARERVQEAVANRGAALGNLLPQISASGSYTRLGTVNEFQMVAPVYRRLPLRVYDPLTGQVIGFTDSVPLPVGADTVHMALGSQNNYLLRATVQQTLFTWGKLLNAYRLAGLGVEVQKAALEQARRETKFSALQAFYQAFLAEKTVGLLEESYEQLQRHVGQVERLYDNGLASRLDLMRARVSLTNMANQLAQMKNAAELARAGLCNLLGIDQATPLVLTGEIRPDTTGFETTALYDTALRRRPELEQLRRACQMADVSVRIARTANLPTLFAAANYDYKRPLGFRDEWGRDWNATVGVSWPIFTGTGNYHKLRAAQSRYRQAVFQLKTVEEAVKLEVRAALAGLDQEKSNIAYQGENVRVAEEAFRLAEERYRNGLISNLEFLDIQLQLTQSRVAYLSAVANYSIARARLLKTIGKL